MDEKELVDNIKNEEEQESKTTPEHNKVKKLIAILLCFALLYAGSSLYFMTKSYTTYEEGKDATMESASDSKYEIFQDKVVKYSKDGINLFNSDGKSVWAETYSMKTPRVVRNNDYLVVADIRGNDAYLFNGTSKIQSFTMPYPICDVELSENGVVAVVLEDQKVNYIQLYDKDGKQIVDSNVSIERSGYPLDIALSKDGVCLAVSHITIDGVDAKNTIGFYNFGSVGQNANSNKYVGGFYYTNTVFPKLEFLNRTTVCAYGDNKAVLYQVKEKPSKNTVEITFESEIRSIFSNDRYIGFVCQNDENPMDGKYLVKVYNLAGKEIYNQAINMNYNKVKFDQNEIILVGDYECMILRLKGKQKFYSHFDTNIADVIPLKQRNDYLLVGNQKITRIKLK